MNMIQKNIWKLQKCCIGCMPDYTFGDYVCFKNIINVPKEHNNKFICNQEPDFIQYH